MAQSRQPQRSDKRQRHKAGRDARRAALEAARRRQQNRKRAIAAVIAIALVVGVISLVASTGGDGTDVATDSTTTTVEDVAAPDPYGTTPCPPQEGAERETAFDSAFEDCLDKDADYHAVIETDLGVIEIDLFEDEAPATVNNFVALARHRAYDDVPFHRVVQDFVVQGGDVENKNGTGGPGYEIPDELPEPEAYEEGSVAMANSGPDSGGSQFFIVTSEAGAETLVQAQGGQAAYSLFGKVTKGMDVVKKIEADANPNDPRDRPKVEHKIVRVTVEER